MAGFWDDYLARKRKQEEEEEERKRTVEAETAEDGEEDSLSFWAGYQRQKRTGESAPVPAEEEESLSLTDRLAQRGIAVDPVARHGTNAQGQTAAQEDTSRTLAALSGNGKAGANLFTDRLGSTFTAARAQRDKLAAQAEEERKDQTVRNQEWLDALRSPEEIQAELEEAKAEKRGNLWNEIVRRLTNAVNAGNVAVPTVERDEARDKAADERVRSLTDELAERQWADYERLRNNADFEAKSQYKSTANGKETKLNPMGGYDSVGFDDPLYEYVNGNEDAERILAVEKEAAGRQNGLLGFLVPEDTYNYEQVSEMTEKERKLYNYIHETKGTQAAYEYLDYLRSDLYARQMEREKDEAAAYAAEHPILSTIGSIGVSPLRGAAYLGQAAQFLTEGEIDQNAPYNRIAALPAAERETVTRTVERNWGKAGSFAYGVGVSMAEFLLNSGISGGNEALSLALMGAGAASDATIEAKERGLADWQSFALGTIAGAAEIITEKVSIEKLFSDPGGRPWKYLLQNILAEGSEEAASDVINLVADVLFTQDKSEWMKSIREYQKDNPGMSEDEAFVQVMKDQGLQILYDAAAGAASGGIMAMPGSVRAFAQLSQDRSQRIEAGRQAVQAKRSQTQESGGGIVLPTAEEETDTGDVIRTGTESDSTNPLRTADELEADERVAKARNITEATGIRYGVDQKEIRRAERLSRITGQEVEFYSHEAENGIVENGHMDPVTGKIWLNAKGKNPLQVTLGHEFTHSLEGTDAYRELVDLAKTQTAEAGGNWAAKADRYARLYEAHGDRVSAEMLDQELTADFVGETLFTDERAIREMFRENPSLGKRVRDAIDNFIVRASDMGGIMSPVDEQKFKNVLKIYDRYVRAMERDEAAQEARGSVQAGETVQTGSRQGEGQIAQETAAVQTAEGRETPAEYMARMDALYEAGEITEDEYDAADALAEEAESTGRGFESSTVEREEGPRGKLGEIADRLRGRYSLSPAERAERQYDIIQNANPAEDDQHTWIRSADEIMDYRSAVEDFGALDGGVSPDFTAEDVRAALDSGRMTVYSSKPIEAGGFVTPSRMEARDYAGGGRVYSKVVALDDVAWIDATEGQYAPVTEDDDGNVIPLSQRFNPKEDDIRYSVSEAEQETTEIAGGDLNSYPYDTRKVIKGYIEAVDENLLDFVNRVNDGEKTPSMIQLGKVSEELGAAVEAAVGINPANGENRLTADAVRHIKRRHGTNGLQDHSMRHPEDIARIQFVLDNFDSVQSTGRITKADRNRDKTLARTVEISKKIDGTYYIIEAVPDTKNNRMTIISAYIEKSRNTVGADAEAPGGTSETNATPVPADNIVSQDGNDVNGGEERFSLSAEEQDRPALNLPNGVKTTGTDEYNQMDRSELGYRLMEYEFGLNNVLDLHDGSLSETEEAMVNALREALDQMANTSDTSELWRAYQHFRTGYQGIREWYFNDDFRADIMRELDPSDVEDLYHSKMIQLQGDGVRYSLSEEQGPIAELPSAKARNNAIQIEGRLAASMARIFGMNTNHTSGEFRQFRAEVVRPIIDAMIEGREDIDPDAIFAEHWNGDLLAGQEARDQFDEAMTQAWRSVQQLNTFADRQRQEAAAREQRNAEIDARIPQDTEGRIRLGENLKQARRERQRVLNRLLLTDDDMALVRSVAAGQITDEEVYAQRPFNYQEILEAAAAERAFREQDEAWGRYTRRLSERRIETADRLLENADRWKDKTSGFGYARETAERNFRDVMGPDSAAMIDEYIRPIHKAEAESTRFKNRYIKRVKDLKLDQKARRGNAVSEAAAVQWLGEAEDNVRYLQTMRNPDAVRDGQNLSEWLSAIEQFRAENPNLDYNKVYRGIAEFSTIYDELITEMNRVLVENGYLPVNVRRGYFPHFNGGDDGILSKFASLLGINIDTNALPTAINGLTSGFKPGKAWFGHAQERTGFRTDYDAVQGFAGYIGGVSDVIHQTANIRNLRTLASRIRYQFGDEGIKNRIDEIMADESRTVEEREAAIRDLTENGRFKNARLVNWLDEYTNLLANKKSKYDRGIEDLMGRRVYTWMKNIEGRVAANMIAGNLGSALTNFIPLNQAGAMLGDWSMLRGAFDTFVGRGRKDDFVQQSDFLTNRRGTDPLIQNRADRISEFLSQPMNIIDNFTSEAIVRAAYGKYLRQGMDAESAMQAADEFAAGVMADRSKGAQPTVFGSRNPLMKLFTQFQVEVNNEFSTIFKDIPKGVHIPDRDKKNMVAVAAWTLLRYFVGAYLFNDLYEKIVGRRAALDPIDILNDAVGDLTGTKLNNVFDMISEGVVDDVRRQNPSDVTQEFFTNAAEELPFVGGLLGGGRIPISSAFPDFENINKAAFSENWSGAKKAQVIGRELGGSIGTYILPPFAGGAIRKGVQTAENALAGGRYVKDKEGNDQLQYPYYTDTPLDTARTVAESMLFGPTATEGGRDWVEGGFGNQTAKNTELYKRLTEDLGEDQRTSYAFISGLAGLDPLGKRVAVSESGLSDEGKAEAMSAVVSDSERYRFRAAYEAGVSADAWTGFWRTLPSYDEDGNGSYKQAEVTAALDNARIPLSAGEGAAQGLFGGDTETRSLTRAEKAAIWSAYNPKWKTDNNPFDASIGSRVVSRIGQMQDEEGE